MANGSSHSSRSATAPAKDAAAWAERTEASLAAAGYKRGGARRAALQLLGAQPCALTAAEIEQALGRRVSRASVYRILDELERLGCVQRVATGQAMARYERVHDLASHHHHLVCEDCGEITPFSDERLEQAIAQASDRVSLKVSEHEIVLRGRCRQCAG